MEDVIHEGLEDSDAIGKAKRHDLVLKMSKRGVKSHLPLVSLSYAEQVVSISEVQLGKDLTSYRGSKEGSMRGRGDLSFIVMSFSPQKSMQGHSKESFFLTKINPAPTGEEDGRMNPEARESLM